MEITRFAQSCFKLDTGNVVIYLDPFKVPKDEEQADLILISHPHFDHYHKKSIKYIFQDDKATRVICPKSCKKIIKKWKAYGMAIGENIEIRGLRIKSVPAYNKKKMFHGKNKNWLGYIIEIENVLFYHAGDTDYIPEMNDLPSLDYAFIPIGGFFTMNVSEAIKALKGINVKNVIPMHERGANLDEFEKKIKKAGINVKVITLKAGKTISIST
ncbi:MAG: MBL fold metallo-hydrolase [Promethearchaeota archaeon]